MVNIETVQELGNMFLNISDEVKEEDEYMIHMLSNNHIESILPMRRGFYENKRVLKANVSNMRSIRDEYEHCVMGCEQMMELLRVIADTGIRAREYLLDEELFVYNPDYMYIDIATSQINLLYLPYADYATSPYMNSGRYFCLADFLLDRIDHHDERAVKIAYEFYRMSKEKLFSIEQFVINMDSITDTVANEKYCEKVIDASYSTDLVEDELTVSGDGTKEKKKRDIFRIFKKSRNEEIIPDYQVTVDDYWGTGVAAEIDCGNVQDDEVTQFFDVSALEVHQISWNVSGREKSATINSFPAVLGKKKQEVDLCIDDPSVSRKHVKLTLRDKELYLEDLYSRNGTYLNGKKLRPNDPVRILPSDKLQLGNVPITVY